jgi:hypothetical protein
LSHLPVQIALAVGALIALRLLLSAVKEARAAHDFDASTALTFGMGWLVSLPSAAVMLTGSLTYQLDVFRNLMKTYPAWDRAMTHLCLVLVAVLAVGLLLRRLSGGNFRVHAAGLIAIALWSVSHLAAGLHGLSIVSQRGLLLLFCLLAATVLPRGRGACLGAALYGVTVAIASAVVAVLHYNVAFAPCTGSCKPLSFQGALVNGDLLGITLGITIPFVYLGLRGRARVWLSIYLAAMVVVTGSKTATAAAIITILGIFLVRPRLDVRNPFTALTGTVLVVAVLVAFGVGQHHWGPTALSGRGELWSVARDLVSHSPLVGYGPDKWASLYPAGEIPFVGQRATHNQWLDVLVASGWIGVLLFVSVAIAMIWSAGPARAAVCFTLTAVAVIGTAEGTWQVGTLDLMSFSIVALILTGASRQPEREPSRLAEELALGQAPVRMLTPKPLTPGVAPRG